jgi:hypothetical protein
MLFDSVPSHFSQLRIFTSSFCDVLVKVKFGIVLNSAPLFDEVQRSGGTASSILNLCSSWDNPSA